MAKSKKRNSVTVIAENIARISALFALVLTIIIMIISAFDNSNSQEANVGSFETVSLNENWSFSDSQEKAIFTIPAVVSEKKGPEVTIVNTLPDNLADGMELMIRASMEDIRIYVDGELRSEYTSNSIDNMTYYIPSAYVVADLYQSDSGKEIEIFIRFKSQRIINKVTISYGNNIWFDVIRDGIFVNLVAVLVLICGIVLFVNALFLNNSFRVGAARNLGLLMIDLSLWIISESTLRQLIFSRPSMSQYYSFFLIEMVGAFACLYFDEVQYRVYHKRYVLLECIVLLQVLINAILYVYGIMPLYKTLMLSHIWNCVCAVVAIVNIVTDFRQKRVSKYRITVIGMVWFILLAMLELLGYYINRFHVFGTEICLALIVLMAATVIQTIYDEVKGYEDREKEFTSMTINTIETIASAIDARDEYTGGHSERVGLYAQRLAREMAADYDLTEDDILRIHYIGLIHDIGKIGVADNVLNKSGWLTDEEFSLMKKHTEIGYEIMSSLGASVDGLLDGIRYHHERFDGNGYPDGLSDTDIPLVARILAIADSYDAMTSNRVYRYRLTDEDVRNEILKCSGTQFDPALTEIFIKLIDSKEISPKTVGGAAVDLSGKIRNSAILERRLQKDMLNNKSVVNPSHVRMLCYVMKLMEKKGKEYMALFIETEDNDLMLKDALKIVLKPHDVNILYTESRHLIALYDSDDKMRDDFIKKIREICPTIVFEYLE